MLTPAPFITHSGAFDLFDAGGSASPELEELAEDGVFGGVEGLATAQLGGAVADVQVAFGPGPGPITPGQSAMVSVNADPAHPLLSFASMLAFSNDAFIGGAAGDGAIDLFPGGSPFSGVIMVMPGDVWDAGTEVNDELAANVPALGGAGGVPENGLITGNHPGILGTGDIGLDKAWAGDPVARITIVPEPSSLILAAVGLLGVLAWVWRRR